MRGFLDFCLAHSLIKVDRLAGTKLAKMKNSGGFHTWSEDEVEKYRTHHAPGTQARLALELLLQTGHASADVVQMGPQHVKHGKLSMRRQKTGVAFDIPLLPDLVEELKRHPVIGLAYLLSERGKPFGAASFGNKFRTWCTDAGLTGCTAHGLRKASAVRHALNGASRSNSWRGTDGRPSARRSVMSRRRTASGWPRAPGSKCEPLLSTRVKRQ